MHLIVCGPAGCGKSSVAQRLHHSTGLPFLEGDSLHPPANIAKMAQGIGLSDHDRQPWLAAIAAWMDAHHPAVTSPTADVATGSIAKPCSIITCSALRRRYRDFLAAHDAFFVMLAVPPAVLAQRLASRAHHFAGPALLDSQLATLEPLAAQERGMTLAADTSLEEICASIRQRLASF